MNGKRMIAAALICVFVLASAVGCTTTRALPQKDPESIAASIGTGDSVAITKTDGTSLEFAVTELSEDGVHGDGIFVPLAEIDTISVVRVSRVRTALLIATAVGAVIVLESHFDFECGLFDYSEQCAE